MSKALTRVAGTCAILLIALIANLTYIQIFKADEYRSASGNARSILQEYSRDRGPILVGRQAVAKSIETVPPTRVRSLLMTIPASDC